MTKAERQYLSRVAQLGCMVCGSAPEIHHVRTGMGKGQRARHIGGVIPLCHAHHRTGGHGVAFHAGKQTWQENFGTEQELLDRVQARLNYR